MITAAEAVKLYDESGYEVDQFFEHTVQPLVTSAAKSGKRTVFIVVGCIKQFDSIRQVVSPVHQAVVTKLVELGYMAEIKIDNHAYVPLGLADDDGNGPLYRNYGISIGW